MYEPTHVLLGEFSTPADGHFTFIMQCFVFATKCLSGEEYPTLRLVYPVYNLLFEDLERFVKADCDIAFTIEEVNAIKAATEKLKSYYAKTDGEVYVLGMREYH